MLLSSFYIQWDYLARLIVGGKHSTNFVSWGAATSCMNKKNLVSMLNVLGAECTRRVE